MSNQSEDMETRFKRARRLYNEAQEYKKDEITLKKLADITHMDKTIYSKLETGKTNPTLEHVQLYHQQFGVTFEFLLGESNARSHENVRVGSDLGVTDDVADTMVILKNASNAEADYTAVLNAFIGNKNATYNFISTILMYLYNDYINHEKNSGVYDTLMTTTVINYINQYVKPQLQPTLEAKQKIEEARTDTTYTHEDYTLIQKMIESCYSQADN